MFAYNPTVNDNSGQITAGYQTKSAEIKAAGNEALAQGIADGVTNFAGGITGAIAKSQANTAKLQGIQATGSAMQAILPQYGDEGMALGQALETELGKAGNNPDKMAGAMMAFMPAMENLQSRYNQAAQIESYKDLYDYKSSTGSTNSSSSASAKLNSESIRSMVAEAKQAGFTDDAIKSKLQTQYGDWAVRSVYPQQNQGIWMGQ
jgi:aspartokinase